jgi:hypothetical protein
MNRTPYLLIAFAWPLTTMCAQEGPPVKGGLSDDARITAVSPDAKVVLREGHKVWFELAVHYSLHSADTAILQVYAERYADNGGKCDDATVHQTEGGAAVRIKRGERSFKVRFRWQEGTGPDAKVPRGAASLAFGMNLWTDRGGKPIKPVIRTFEKSFCRAVQP